MKVTAAVIDAPGGDFRLQEMSLDDPRPDEILIRVVGVGICHTDLVARDQHLPVPLPAVLGHEASGIVEKVGQGVTKVVAGDHVVITFRSCGHCARCGANEPAYCEDFVRLNYACRRSDGSVAFDRDGQAVSSNFFGQSSFSTFALASERSVVKVDRRAPLAILGPLACGVQTGAGAVLRALACPAGSSIAIFGGGTVGLSAVMGAVVAGCDTIIVSDPLESRRALALELGATHVFDPAGLSVPKEIRKLCNSGVDYALDMTGQSQVMEDALKSLRPRGTLGLLGIPPRVDMPTPGRATNVLAFGYTIRGIIEGDSDPDSFIPELVALHREGRFPFDRLIRTYSFSDINLAVHEQEQGAVVKPVLLMPSDQRGDGVTS